jgi:uncharacterized protein YkwD
VAYKKARRMLGAGALAASALVPAASAHASVDTAIVQRINAVRAEHGLQPLRLTAALDRAATDHCREMIAGGGLTHADAAGSLGQRLRRYVAASTFGETIAWMPTGRAGTVVRAWLNSPPHRAVLLSPQFGRVGIGELSGSMGGRRGVSFTADFAT